MDILKELVPIIENEYLTKRKTYNSQFDLIEHF
jgi:hypothetical protein